MSSLKRIYFFLSLLLFCKNTFAYEQVIFELEENQTLSEIAFIFYGRASYTSKIIEWNQVSNPKLLKPGTKITLLEKPIRSEEEGKNALRLMWEERRKKKETLSASGTVTATPEQTQKPTKIPIIEIKKELSEKEKNLINQYESEIEKQAKKEKDVPKTSEMNAEEHLKIGEVLFNEKKFEEAYSHLQQSRDMNSESVRTWILEIRTLKELKRFDESIRVAEKFIEEHPDFKEIPFIQKTLEKNSGDQSQ